MAKDTAGNEIYEPLSCDCGLTGGCLKCNPLFKNAERRIMNKPEKRDREDLEFYDDFVSNDICVEGFNRACDKWEKYHKQTLQLVIKEIEQLIGIKLSEF